MSPLLQKDDYRLFSWLLVGWVAWLFLVLVLGMAGWFFSWLFWIGALIGIGVFGSASFRHKFFSKLSKELLLVAGISFALAILYASMATPTVFSGRDQGSYSSAAIHLAQETQLRFSTPVSETFFKIYGPGKALNFPGYFYTESGELLTQFPLGSIVWLSSLFSLFGLAGFAVANAVTLFLFLLGFYLLLRIFISPRYAVAGGILSATAFLPVWFAKFTLSENLALALFIGLSLQLILFLREKSPLAYWVTLALAAFFVFTRIEGWGIFILTLIILWISNTGRSLWPASNLPRRIAPAGWQAKPLTHLILPLFIFCLTLVWNIFANYPFYHTLGKVVYREWLNIEDTFPAAATLLTPLSFIETLWAYGLLLIILLGIFSLPVLWKRKEKLAFVPILLALPGLVYLFAPHISPDHPWFLRRYLFAAWPALLFTVTLGIAYIQERLSSRYPTNFFWRKPFFAAGLFAVLLLIQLPAFFRLGFVVENHGLLEQTKSLSENFLPTDLVLVDRLTSGDPWSMLPEPMQALFGRQTVYFFNPEDLEKIDTMRFSNVYLVIPNQSLPLFETLMPRLVPLKPFTFTTTRFKIETSDALPHSEVVTTKGYIYKLL